MPHVIVVLVTSCTLLLFSPWALPAKESVPQTTASFLNISADSQQQEIDLGHLAMEKAQDEQVKQFGTRMVEDHQKAQQEIRQLASKEGLHLTNTPSDAHKQLTAHLSRLAGKEFDRAYLSVTLREHTKTLQKLGQQAVTEQDQEVRQWAAGAVPAVKEHLAKAKTIASSLGIKAAASQ